MEEGKLDYRVGQVWLTETGTAKVIKYPARFFGPLGDVEGAELYHLPAGVLRFHDMRGASVGAVESESLIREK